MTGNRTDPLALAGQPLRAGCVSERVEFGHLGSADPLTILGGGIDTFGSS
jgi:hypothetical protein